VRTPSGPSGHLPQRGRIDAAPRPALRGPKAWRCGLRAPLVALSAPLDRVAPGLAAPAAGAVCIAGGAASERGTMTILTRGRRLLRFIAPVAVAALSLGAAAPVGFVDLATPFERVATATEGQPPAARVAAVRSSIDALLPGVYPARAATDQRIARALAEFPAQQAEYDRAVAGFPAALADAVTRFRRVFPDFAPQLPIYLYHSLGVRDGGSAYLEPGHRPVILFGADVIGRLHADDSLEPFLDHELFHLQHARTFPDCEPLWCVLWQEGLAVDAAAAMTPGASDHQLLLDQPAAIRAPTDAHWTAALCFIAAHFDDPDEAAIGQALLGGGRPPSGLPDRFGYYVGFRIAQATGRSITELGRLDHAAARRLLRATLVRLMAEAKAGCPPPAAALPQRAGQPL
jgi:hypothetical protein